MPSLVFWIAGFLSGWCLGTFLLIGQSDGRRQIIRYFVGCLIILSGIGAGVLSYGEWDFEYAARIEQSLLGRRHFGVIAAAFLGFFCALYRDEVFKVLEAISDITLKLDRPSPADSGPKSPELTGSKAGAAQPKSKGVEGRVSNIDKSLPWFIQAGLFGALLIILVLAFNPGVLRNLTSLKAGGWEAHFAAVPVSIQRTQISALDANRRSTASNWAKFSFPTADDPRAALYTGEGGVQDQQAVAAKRVFEKVLSPIFKSWAGLDDVGAETPDVVAARLRPIIARLAERIKATAGAADTQKQAEVSASAEKEIERVVGDICKTWDLSPCKPETGIEDASSRKDRQQSQPSTSKESGPDTSSGGLDDPYVIQAVGDLLMLTGSRRHREDFLYAVADKRMRDKTIPTAGQLSLRYATVDAQVQSERPWPFEKLLEEIGALLDDVNRAIRHNRDLKNAVPESKAKLDAIQHRNRLIDLTVGLQFFYQRAIAGQRFTLTQLQTWGNWLKEVRDVLAIVGSDGSRSSLAFDRDEEASWRSARTEITSDPAIIQDAALAAALGVVLQPQQSGSVSSTDCLAARSLYGLASREFGTLFERLSFDADDKATYRGFAERIRDRIEGECG